MRLQVLFAHLCLNATFTTLAAIFAHTFIIAQISLLFFLLQNFSEVRMWYGRLTYEVEFLLVLACVLCLHCMTTRSCTYTLPTAVRRDGVRMLWMKSMNEVH